MKRRHLLQIIKRVSNLDDDKNLLLIEKGINDFGKQLELIAAKNIREFDPVTIQIDSWKFLPKFLALLPIVLSAKERSLLYLVDDQQFFIEVLKNIGIEDCINIINGLPETPSHHYYCFSTNEDNLLPVLWNKVANNPDHTTHIHWERFGFGVLFVSRASCLDHVCELLDANSFYEMFGLSVNRILCYAPLSMTLQAFLDKKKEYADIKIITYTSLDEAIININKRHTSNLYISSYSDYEIKYLKQNALATFITTLPIDKKVVERLSFAGVKSIGRNLPLLSYEGLEDYLLPPSWSTVEKGSVEFKRGSDYIFRPSRPNFEFKARKKILINAFERLITHYPSLHPAHPTQEMDILTDFFKWLNKDADDFFTRNIKDNSLFCYDFSYPKEHTLLISHTASPHFSFLFEMLSAIIMGSGVTILTRGEKSFSYWTRVIRLFHNEGVLKDNLDCYLCTEQLLKNAMGDGSYSAIILDGTDEDIRQALRIAPNENKNSRCREYFFGDNKIFERYNRYYLNRILVKFSSIRVIEK